MVLDQMTTKEDHPCLCIDYVLTLWRVISVIDIITIIMKQRNL